MQQAHKHSALWEGASSGWSAGFVGLERWAADCQGPCYWPDLSTIPQGSSSSAHHQQHSFLVCALSCLCVFMDSLNKTVTFLCLSPPCNETPKTAEAVMLALIWFIAALWSSSALLLVSPTKVGSAQSRTYGAYKHSCWSGNSLCTNTSELRLDWISILALFPLPFGWVGLSAVWVFVCGSTDT